MLMNNIKIDVRVDGIDWIDQACDKDQWSGNVGASEADRSLQANTVSPSRSSDAHPLLRFN
jgi:hypothetical protein